MYRMVLRHDVGGQAPDFTLKDGSGKEVALASFRPNVVVLVFFAGGFDRDALRGLREFARSNQRIRDSDAVVVAVTPELPGKVQTLVENLGLPFTILSDPEMKVVKEYDTYNPVTNWAWPAAFIIDREGVIQYAFRGASPPNTPPLDYILLKLTWMKEGKAPAAAGRART
jgi:peroxiredoxin Q/BCP